MEPAMTPPIGVAKEGIMRRNPAADGESPRTAWKYSGIMNIYWRGDQQTAASQGYGTAETHSIRTHAGKNIRQLNHCGLQSIQHAKWNHRDCLSLGLDGYEHSKQQKTRCQRGDNGETAPWVLVSPQAQPQKLRNQSYDKKEGTREIQVSEG
jgi:hypothetical protein